MECAICKNKIIGYGNNGRPLVDGLVCDDCNWKVISERLRLSKEAKESKNKEATEAISLGEVDGVVVGSGGPVNTTDPLKDFEGYAKQFEETFLLGKFNIRKIKPENKTKVSDGNIVGEVISLEKNEEELPQAEVVNSATESLHGFSEIYEFILLCKELGLNNFEEIEKFIKDNPGDPLSTLKNYRYNVLGKDWENKELTEEDKEMIKGILNLKK